MVHCNSTKRINATMTAQLTPVPLSILASLSLLFWFALFSWLPSETFSHISFQEKHTLCQGFKLILVQGSHTAPGWCQAGRISSPLFYENVNNILLQNCLWTPWNLLSKKKSTISVHSCYLWCSVAMSTTLTTTVKNPSGQIRNSRKPDLTLVRACFAPRAWCLTPLLYTEANEQRWRSVPTGSVSTPPPSGIYFWSSIHSLLLLSHAVKTLFSVSTQLILSITSSFLFRLSTSPWLSMASRGHPGSIYYFHQGDFALWCHFSE